MKKRNYILIIVFLLIIFTVPILGIISQDNATSEIENRSLTSLPIFNLIDFQKFANAFDDYVVDQFPGRNIFLKIYTKIELLQNKKIIRDTYVLDEYLFIRDYNLAENNLNNLAKAIGFRSINEDIDFHYVAFPNKMSMLGQLYPEYLDYNISLNNNKVLKEKLSAVGNLQTISTVDYVLEESTVEEREDYYYKTDFHWNAKGAYRAFQIMIENIEGKDVLETAESKLERKEYPEKYFNGDLEKRFSGNIKNEDVPDSYELKNTENLSYYTSIDDSEPVEREDIVLAKIKNKKVSYNDIYTENLSCIRIINEDAAIDKTIVVFKDSYFNAIVDSMTAVYKELIIIDPRFYNEGYSYGDIISMKNPDDILFCYHQSNIDQELITFLSK